MSNIKDARWFTGLINVERVLTKIIRVWCSLWFSGLIVCMILQVFTRFILEAPLPWTDEGARYLWATLCFIGCGAAITDNAHIEINIISSLLKGVKRRSKEVQPGENCRYCTFHYLNCPGQPALLSVRYIHGNDV